MIVRHGLAILAAAWMGAAAAGTLGLEEEAAFRAAVDRVAGSVVRIEPAGVSEAAIAGPAEAAPAAGPSSGLVVDADGWILTTSFAVPKDASEAIVVPSDGRRQAARVVGRDLSRGLVLLKIGRSGETAEPTDGKNRLPVPEWAPRGELAVGQWTLAVGRTWSQDAPNVAVGILSATNRAWGKAVQTDASVSPANYGGPLVDIEGRVIGILAPLPADTAGMMAGTELYDSGIGFAVPMEDVIRVLPRLKEGKTLAPGIMGIGYKSRDLFNAVATIATCRTGSPAAIAGLRSGDTVVEAGGKPVTRVAELRNVIAPLYAGDSVDLVVERPRGEAKPQRITATVKLAETLPPWRRPILGIVPSRVVSSDRDQAGGDAKAGQAVKVGWVWPNGPAAQAGIRPGDVVESIAEVGGEPAADAAAASEPLQVSSAAALAGFVGGTEIGRPLRLSIRRGSERLSLDVTTSGMPKDIAADVPADGRDPAKTTIERIEAADLAKPPLVVLPESTPQRPLGVLVFFAPPPGVVAADKAGQSLAESWKAAATRHGIAVILPASADPQRWGRGDIAAVAKAIDALRARRPIDPSRLAFAGRGAGGAFAWLAAESLGPAVRGIAIIESSLPRQATIEPAEPGGGRWVLFGYSAAQPPTRLEADRRRLEENGFPVGVLSEIAGDAVPAEKLCGWVESLGLL